MLNTVIFEGRLVQNPESRGGGKVAAFALAHEENWRDETQPDGWAKRTHYVDVSCFSDVAQRVLESRRKGDTVVVEGRLEQNKWTTDDGVQRARVRIQAMRVNFVRAPQNRVEQELTEALTQGAADAAATAEQTEANDRVAQLEAELAAARAEQESGVEAFSSEALAEIA